jgi:hypothetical protein
MLDDAVPFAGLREAHHWPIRHVAGTRSAMGISEGKTKHGAYGI